MPTRLTFDQLEIGQTWTSDSRTITEADVVNFANITGDFNPLHMSHAFAEKTHYRRPIAHGLLGLSWVAGLGSNSPCVETVAFIGVTNWEFLKPLYFGDTVHVVSEVIGKTANGRRTGRITWRHQLLNQHEEIAQQGIFETLVSKQALVKRPHISESGKTQGAKAVNRQSD